MPLLAGAECQALLSQFKEDYERLDYAKGDPSKFLYFLHVPRTAGRTYFSCLVRPAYPPSKRQVSRNPSCSCLRAYLDLDAGRCPKSYDRARVSPDANCTLLSSHDDFSLAPELPPGAAVFTQIRDPLDRTLSAYEMALEARQRHAGQRDNGDDLPILRLPALLPSGRQQVLGRRLCQAHRCKAREGQEDQQGRPARN